MRMSGKALVTGASGGMGLELARILAANGYNLYLVARSGERLVEICASISEEYGVSANYLAADLTDMGQVDLLPGFTGDVDILVNNAGTILRKPAAEHPDEYWDKVMNVNINSQFVLAREFGKDMVARGWGKIVFTCSLLTFQGGITVPGYAASKGAVGQLVKALANEWAPKGVNVNGIAPGYIATDNTAALRADPVRSRQILERIPAGRWGEASDIAGACVFLCSPAAAYIHGEIIPVDGGWLAR